MRAKTREDHLEEKRQEAFRDIERGRSFYRKYSIQDDVRFGSADPDFERTIVPPAKQGGWGIWVLSLALLGLMIYLGVL